MNSSDYRRIARENLAGNWGAAVLAAFVAAIFGALVTSSGFSFNLELDEEMSHQIPDILKTYILTAAGIGSTLNFLHFILGGVVRQGYVVYLLKQYDRREQPETRDLFSQFHRFGDGFCLALLQGIFIALWTMLFIIPGIIASYRYAMAPFIMAENPDMTASEAINASKAMMEGHKADLFMLDLSFIGWGILNIFTLGIGSFWLNPYTNAAHAAFYRNLSSQPIVE